MLSAEQLQHYGELGYLVVPGLVGAPDLARWDSHFCDLISGRTPMPERLLVVRDVMVAKDAVQPKTPLHAVNKIHSFEDDTVLIAYVEHPAVVACVEDLIGARVMSIATNLINKPPGVDGRHPLHQDLFYFPLRPADHIVGVWTALGSATRENGCLAVVPGSHRGGERKHADPDWEYVNAGFFGAEGAELEERVHVELKPGDTIFFHPLLLHGSGHNRTSEFRRAISAHYARQDCEGVGRPDVSAHTFRPVSARASLT